MTSFTRQAPSPPLLSTLPRALVDSIFSFALEEHEFNLTSVPKLHPRFIAIASVCTEWHSLLEDIACERSLRYLCLDESGVPSRSRMLETRRQFTLRRKYARRFEPQLLADYGAIGDGVWSAAFSLLPKLKQLDLGDDDLSSGEQYAWLVRAAGRHCLELETLRMPVYISATSEEKETEEAREMMHLVFRSAEKWKQKTGGLRHFSINVNDAITDCPSAVSFLNGVATHCPRVEVLDGYKGDIERGDCGEQWWVDLETWERFCQTCTQLKEFDWIVAPFTTRFFEIFAQYHHPQLTKLGFQVASNWEWKEYLGEVGPATRQALEATGFGLTATNALAVLASCPALQELSIDCEVHGVELSRATKQGLDLEFFSDEFCEALAKHCRQLTNLKFGDPRRIALAPPLVKSFTDRAMHALASLPLLETVQLGAVNATGDGLFELVFNHAAESSKTRSYVINHGRASLTFYSMIEGLLKRIATWDGELPCGSRGGVTLRLICTGGQADTTWCFGYLRRLQSLAREVMAKHMTLQLRGLLRGFEQGTFNFMEEFQLATIRKVHFPKRQLGRSSVPHNTLDDVFVCVSSDEEDEEEEDEEDEDDEDDGGYWVLPGTQPYRIP